MKRALLIALFTVFFLHLIFRIFSYSAEYIKPFDQNYWKMRYDQSQWVVVNSKNPIGDDGLFAYEGWEYIHGSNPVLLNPEIPPLGKYIIGFGEVVFNNQNILIMLVSLACLLFFYLLNIQLFKSKLFAFIPVFLFSFDPLFYSQLRAPYLDSIYLLSLLLTLFFAVKRKYIVMAIFLGCFSSIKFPASSLFLLLPIFVWVFLYDRKQLKKFFISLLLWPAVFLSSYIMYFVHGGGIAGFFGVQKGIMNFYIIGAKASPGIVYPMIATGNWYTWFAGLQSVKEWTILWPLSLFGSVVAAVLLMFYARKSILNHKLLAINNINFMLILFWVLSYLVFLSFTPVFPRYLLLLVPFMYNLSIWACVQLGKRYFGRYFLQ